MCFGREITMVVWKSLFFAMFGKSRGGEGGRKEEGGWEGEREDGSWRREKGGRGRKETGKGRPYTDTAIGSCPPQGNSR